MTIDTVTEGNTHGKGMYQRFGSERFIIAHVNPLTTANCYDYIHVFIYYPLTNYIYIYIYIYVCVCLCVN